MAQAQRPSRRSRCRTCRTLAATGSTAGIGPNLVRVRPSWDCGLSMIGNASLSGLMPAGILTGDDAARVVAYVAGAAGRG